MSNRLCMITLLLSSAMALALNTATAADQEHTDRTVRFKQIDKNADGKLSLQEFQNRPSNNPNAAPPDAKELANRAERFGAVDKNKDGFLSFDEFVALMNVPVAAPANTGGAHSGH